MINPLQDFVGDSSSTNADVAQEERVEVNQRALIDKILARYASAGAVYRELLQNSNDAEATRAEIRFSTTNNGVVTQVLYRNNGLVFGPQDWARLRKIAEGNPNPSKVGAFGVGAYTMFSIAEEPWIISADTALQFVWKGDALWTKTTKRTTTTKTTTTKTTNNNDTTEWTTFVLPSRDPYPLPNWTDFGQFLAASLTFTNSLCAVSVYVNDEAVLSISKRQVQPPRPLQVVETTPTTTNNSNPNNNTNGSTAQNTTTTTTTTTTKKWTSWFSLDGSSTTNNSTTTNSNQQNNNKNNKVTIQTSSPRNLFQLESLPSTGDPAILESVYEIQVAVYHNKKNKNQSGTTSGTSSLTDTGNQALQQSQPKQKDDDVATIRARYVTAQAKVQLPPDMVKRMHRVTKKNPPATVPLQIYLDAPAELSSSGSSSTKHRKNKKKKKKNSPAHAIAQSFVPVQGRIFIGFRTSQTTGVAAHVAAPFLPTVEREAMDLQDATLRIYNVELLHLTGMVLRLVLQHAFCRLAVEYRTFQLQQQQKTLTDGTSTALEEEQDSDDEEEDSEDETEQVPSSSSNDDDDKDEDASIATSTTTNTNSGFMGFARFMARGMRHKIQSVVTTISDEVSTKTGLSTTSLSQQRRRGIDYAALVGVAPDPRPLNRFEVHAIYWMQALCPTPSTPDPTVGTMLAQGFGRALPTTPAPCWTSQAVVPAQQARLPAHGMEAFCRSLSPVASSSTTMTTTTTTTRATKASPPAVVRHVVWQSSLEYHAVIASQCRPLELERDLLPYFQSTILTQAMAIRLVQWWKPYSRILAHQLAQRQPHANDWIAQQVQTQGLALKDSIRFTAQLQDTGDDDEQEDDWNAPVSTGSSAGPVMALQTYLFYLDKESPLGKHQTQQALVLRQQQKQERQRTQRMLAKQREQQQQQQASVKSPAGETSTNQSLAAGTPTTSSSTTNGRRQETEEEESLSSLLLPLPETVLPTRLQELLGDTTLSDACISNIWFQPFPMVLWVEFMAHHSILTHGLAKDSPRRLAVLSLLHQEYKDRGSKFRTSQNQQQHEFTTLCRNLLYNTKCIPYDAPEPKQQQQDSHTNQNGTNLSPTKALVDVPSALYLYSAELQAFEGVAGGSSFHKVSKQVQEAGVTEDFLLALGVRKSVSIDFLFQNLDSLQWNHDPRPLIEYLKTATLTNDDWAKLSQTQYLPAEEDLVAEGSTTKQENASDKAAALVSTKNYAPSELYLPNVELRIFPFLKILKWPTETELSERSENGRFLVRLGMKVMPPLQQVLQYLSQPTLDPEKRVQALDYVANHLSPSAPYHAEYNRMSNMTRKRYRFLPCTAIDPLAAADTIDATASNNKGGSKSSSEPLLLSPPLCFSDAQCAVMGFPVLIIDNAKKVLGDRRDFYASVFQCPHQPEPTVLVNQLLNLVSAAKRKQQSLKRKDEEAITTLNTIILSVFASVFNYLSHRSSDISPTLLGSLRTESFIPCLKEDINTVEWFRVDQVFFLRRESGKGGPSTSNTKDSLTEELFQVVEFSPFLAAAGVKQDATTKELFQRLLDDPIAVMQALGTNEKKYRALLRRIAADPPFSVVNDKIRNTPFLLAYSLNYDTSSKKDGDDDDTNKAADSATFDLVAARDIYIIDNSFFGRMFKVYRAPPETDLEDFYAMIGSQYISKSVERRFEVVGKPMQHTPLTRALQERVKERAPLLVSPHVTTRPLVNNAASLLDPKRLEFYQATTLLAVYSLRGITRRSKTTCFSRRSAGILAGQGQRNSIYVVDDFDWFDVGYALGDLILKRCQLEDAFFISSLLDAPLEQLRARGFPVDRILQPVVVVPPPASPKPEPPKPPPAKPVATGVRQPDGSPMVWNPDGTIATDIPPRTDSSAASNKAAPDANTAAAPMKPNAEPSKGSTSSQPPSDTAGMEEILTQMFPDADSEFIKGALGPNPDLESVRSLAEAMAAGKYPKKLDDDADLSTSASMDDTASIQTEATSSFEDGTEKKKRGRLRKKLGRALGFGGGSKASPPTESSAPSPPPPPPPTVPPPQPPAGGAAGVMGGLGGMMGSGGGPSAGSTNTSAGPGETTFRGPSMATRHEERGPVTPAEDIHSQQNLERMLEQTVGNTTNVNRNGIQSPETLLTSIPEGSGRHDETEVIDGQSLKPFPGPRGTGKARNGIRVFASTREPSSELLLQNDQVLESFALVLENLAKVFGVRLESMAIFNEPGGRSIAFNSNRSLHFNLRFYHSLHFLPGQAFSRECYSFWYITMAHELSHNLVSGHNKEHGYYTESFATHYLPRLVDLLANLSNRSTNL